MLMARVIITTDRIAGNNYTAIGVVPTEIVDGDTHLGEHRDEIIGQDLQPHHRLRNAVVVVEPKGNRFVPLLSKDLTGNDPLPGVGEEIMMLFRVNSPEGDNRSIVERAFALSWSTVEAYSRGGEEAAKKNEDLPELKNEIDVEYRSLWRMTSESARITIGWMTPQKLADKLHFLNRGLVPADAKWFRRDPEIGKQLVEADEDTRKAIIQQMQTGVESSARPKALTMMRTGVVQKQERRSQPKQRTERLGPVEKEILAEHRSDGQPHSSLIQFPATAEPSATAKRPAPKAKAPRKGDGKKSKKRDPRRRSDQRIDGDEDAAMIA